MFLLLCSKPAAAELHLTIKMADTVEVYGFPTESKAVIAELESPQQAAPSTQQAARERDGDSINQVALGDK